MLTDPITGEQFQFVTRAEWGARPPKWSSQMSRYDGSYSHHGVSSQQPSISIWKGYQSWHMDGNNWPDIGYTHGYDDNGVIYEGRGWTTTGAHTYGFNEVSLGYCYIGNSDRVPPPPKALRALWCLIRVGEQKWGRTGYVRDHREGGVISGSGTSCPGSGLYGKAAEVRNTPIPPPDPDGDDEVKPVIVVDPRPGRSAWHVFGNTRYRLADQAEVDTLKYLGTQVVTGDPANPDPIVNWLRACKDLGRPEK
jgi:hypothetical protein